MPVSQRFIDLLNVPRDLLASAAEKDEIDGAKAMDKWQLAGELEQKPRTDLENLAEGFLYAGRTSVSWFRLVEQHSKTDGFRASGSRLSGVPLLPDAVREALQATADCDPFDPTSRPETVTGKPTLVSARDFGEGRLLLTFAYRQRKTRVIRDFEVSEVANDEFINAILDVSNGVLEVRTNQRAAQMLQHSWLGDFASKQNLEPQLVDITRSEVERLKAALGAGLTRYRGKAEDGGSVDTVELTVSPEFDDLDGEQDFEARRAGSEQVIGDLSFKYDEEKFTIRVSSLRGSVYFVTPAPEVVVDYVRDHLRAVKNSEAG